jgi:serine/threonine-protein kinase HipA
MAARPPLRVLISGRLVGHLLDADGVCSFAYIDDQTVPRLSASMPWRAGPYPALVSPVRSVIEGWLPEDRLRDAVARQLGVSPEDHYALLEAIGIDCAGAVQVLPAGPSPEQPSVRWLAQAELVSLIEELPRAPLGPNEDLRVRASLAGVQGKLPVVIEDGKTGLPRGGVPSTHILKPQWRPGPDDPQWHDLVANEAFCMRLAEAARLNVAKVAPTVIGERPVLVVHRFDRYRDSDGIKRLHQEDLAQASGTLPARKYEADGGPSLVRLVEALRDAGVAPVQAFPELLDAITVAAATGNADQHAKNLAVLYDPEGARLAPLYDLTSTMVYPDLTKMAALRIGGVAYIDEVDDEACTREAVSWGMPEQLARARIASSVERLHASLDSVLAGARDEGWVRPVVHEAADLVRQWPKRSKS